MKYKNEFVTKWENSVKNKEQGVAKCLEQRHL